MKAKVVSVTIGKYDYDSLTLNIDGRISEIAFNKKENIKKYDGKLVEINKVNNVFVINELKETKVNDKSQKQNIEKTNQTLTRHSKEDA